ncbi:helix-turn-helix domain-containing protein [Devosia sediminis]|uniref:Helix-turn-helix domain-containing protein n=1 Tax=Devosia sediminis TaxID=2798801 RepID=A0A934MPJ3_9HYPH|nr:helix-turn-helix domain-containing protein [Devosia sediminis]MBJ3783379.1 helix-turn-helix domain-containing protein [Devosia sediminis]
MTKTPPVGWNRHTIKAAIGIAGLTMAAIAKGAGIEPWQVRHGLRGNNRTGAEAIAKALGLPFRTLFHDSYLNGGADLAQPIQKQAGRASQNARAAADRAQRAS